MQEGQLFLQSQPSIDRERIAYVVALASDQPEDTPIHAFTVDTANPPGPAYGRVSNTVVRGYSTADLFRSAAC